MGKRLGSFLLAIVLAIFSASISSAVPIDDHYIAGYATAVLEREIGLRTYSMSVKEGVITVRDKNLTAGLREKIINTLSLIPGVVRVEVADVTLGQKSDFTTSPPIEYKEKEKKLNFFPKGKLFAPLLADPRWPHFSAAYLNWIGNKEFDNVGAVSFGESFSLYRDDSPLGGVWECGIEAAVFSVFDLDAASHDLINSDFWVAFPSISYRDGRLSALGRLFHQSSHLGDEYLLRNRVDRVNLSYEGISLKLSYDFYAAFRGYGGCSYLFHRYPSNLEPWSTQLGLEFESTGSFLKGAARPVAAMDLQHHEESDWDTNLSLRFGIQFENPEIVTRKYQLMLEYYHGYSPHGQFYRSKIEYLGIGTHLYF